MLRSFIKKIVKRFSSIKLYPYRIPVSDEHLFDNKTALITGGCGGIGYAIAKMLLSKGCNVIITGTNDSKLASALSKLKGGKGLKLDLLNISSIDYVVEDAFALSETGKIEILINAAGINNRDSFLDTTVEDFEKIMTVNLEAAYFLSQSVAKRMIKLKIKGHILNISSSSALRPAWSPYRLSKCALTGLTKGLADVLLPYGIIVNAIGSGPTATSMMAKNEGDSIFNEENPSGRYATPEEIAYLATYLVSDMANLVVGDTFYITGGSGTISYHK